MAAISSGVARPAVSSITETRYCISDHLLCFGAPLVGGLTPATNTSAPIRHRLADFFQELSGPPAVNDPTPQRFRVTADVLVRGVTGEIGAFLPMPQPPGSTVAVAAGKGSKLAVAARRLVER